jgi:hypothetical protein
MSRTVLAISAVLATGLAVNGAQAEKAAPNLSGNYRCVPNPTPCAKDATTFTVTHKGNRVEFKSDGGLEGGGTATSPMTISVGAPWNMMGVVHKEGEIHWSNGTIWRKQ